MDNNIGLQIKRLIEIDRKAVELAERRELEFKDLEQKHRADMERINNMLQLAKEEAKCSYNEMMKQTQQEIEVLSTEIDNKLLQTEQAMFQAVDELAEEIWSKVLESIK